MIDDLFERVIQGMPVKTETGSITLLVPVMTLRDWLAGQVLAGTSADPTAVDADPSKIAKWCYLMADAMLAAREKEARG
jgi:hypothetical protein